MAILLGRKYIEDSAYGGKIALSRIRTTANPDALFVAPIASNGDVTVVSAIYNGQPIVRDRANAQIAVNANNPTDGGLITIAGQAYTLKATLTASTTADEILISNDPAIMCTAIIDAVNANPATAGTSFGSLTVANKYVVAYQGLSTLIMLLARVDGPAAGIPLTKTTDTSTGFTLSGSTFSSGTTNSGTVFSQLPAVLPVSGDRTVLFSLVRIFGYPIDTEIVLMTVHGNLAGVNSSAIG